MSATKLSASEAALLVNFKIYVTRADETLSEQGITMLAKIAQLQNLLCRVARIAPKSLERVLAGPLEIIKVDRERREMEERERRQVDDQERRDLRRALAVDSDDDSQEKSKKTKKRRLANSQIITMPEATGTMVEDSDSGAMSVDLGKKTTGPSSKTNTAAQKTGESASIASKEPQPELANVLNLAADVQTQANTLLRSPSTGVNEGTNEEEGTSDPASSRPSAPKSGVPISLPSHKAPTAVMKKESGSKGSILASSLNTEIALCSQDPDTIQQLIHEFKNIVLPKCPRRIHPEKLDDDIQAILVLCQKLNFDAVKYRLLEFADRRQKKPGSKARVTDLADKAEPQAIFNAIQVSAANEIDAKLHRIYGQLRLIKSIDEKIAAAGPGPHGATPDGSARPSVFYLDELAHSMCEEETADIRTKTKGKLRREYNGGRQWMKMIKDLGGEGVIFVFIFAGRLIAPS